MTRPRTPEIALKTTWNQITWSDAIDSNARLTSGMRISAAAPSTKQSPRKMVFPIGARRVIASLPIVVAEARNAVPGFAPSTIQRPEDTVRAPAATSPASIITTASDEKQRKASPIPSTVQKKAFPSIG